MAEHKDCKHYDGCGYRNDIGCCPNWCAQFKHKDDVRVVRCKNCMWFEPNEDIMPQSGSCALHEMVKMFWDFCSRARMDGDGNE